MAGFKLKRKSAPSFPLIMRPRPDRRHALREAPRESIANETYFVCCSPVTGCYVYQYEIEGDLRTVFLHCFESESAANQAIEKLARKRGLPPGDRLEPVKVDLWDAIRIVETYPVTPRHGSLVVGIYCQYDHPVDEELGMVHYYLDGDWYIGDRLRKDIFYIPKGK